MSAVTVTDDAEDVVHPFGIDAATGRPLSGLTDEVVTALLGGGHEALYRTGAVALALGARGENGEEHFALRDEGDTDPNNLAEAGWGILYGPGVGADIKKALQPLIDRRRAEAKPLVIFEPEDFVPGEDAYQWLKRHKVSLNVVNPALGVPYYLMIVASPDAIPFEFQYVLDLYWAVGRVWFDTPDEFGRYAQSVVDYEKAEQVAARRHIALFAPEHDFDAATQLFTRQVAQPLCGVSSGGGVETVLGARMKYTLQPFLGETATKQHLTDIYCGASPGGRPALLFSGGHGMQFNHGDALQLNTQGALVCQDWDRTGEITAKDWFAAADLPGDAQVHGLIQFMFACHGGGVPQFDNFDRLGGQPRRIAPGPFFSKLPQALLAHRNGGALAVVAHIERAWAYSFQGDGGLPQVQGFRNVLSRILAGQRIGEAMDTFNINWAAIAARLSEAQLARERDPSLSVRPIGRLWVQRDDARNFMVFGDPAVRLRVKEMAAQV